MENKKKIEWIVGGVVVAVVVIYLAVSGNINIKSQPGNKNVEGTQTSQGIVVATGTSAVATSGQVVTPQGEPVKLDVAPMSPDAPQQSAPVKESDLPASALKISVSATGFSPSEFTVNSGAPVSISVTSSDDQTHIFKFEDRSLSAVAVGIGPHETRVITFNAPSAGEYAFFCDVPGHRGRGEVGKMIVK